MSQERIEYVGFWGCVLKWWLSLGQDGRLGAFLLTLFFMVGFFLTGGLVTHHAIRESNETERLRLLAEHPELSAERRTSRMERLQEIRQALENESLDGSDRGTLVRLMAHLAEGE